MRGANSELLDLATKANQLASQVSRHEESYRAAGRLARDPHDIDALSEAIVQGAKEADGVLADFMRAPEMFVLSQLALSHVSNRLWEDLWNETHPDRFGQAWDGEDFALMSVWRVKVRAMIQGCSRGFVLATTTDEYIAKLIKAGANEETTKELVNWMSEVMYEEVA